MKGSEEIKGMAKDLGGIKIKDVARDMGGINIMGMVRAKERKTVGWESARKLQVPCFSFVQTGTNCPLLIDLCLQLKISLFPNLEFKS